MPEDDACLLPLDQFDHPGLHQRPPKWLPLPFVRSHLNMLFGKACAGMSPNFRADGWAIAQGFRRGVLSRREFATLRWAAPGLWEGTLGMLHVMGRASRHPRCAGVRVHGRGKADEKSDVDLLVTLPPDKTGLALGGLLMDVQDLLQRRVDLVTEGALHPALRDRVLREAQPL